MKSEHRAFAVAFWCVVVFGCDRAIAQITDPVERKSWFLLQKLATEFNELLSCSIVAAVATGPDGKRYVTAAIEKSELFVREADAFVQRYASRRGKDETMETFRFRVWSVPIGVGIHNARPVEKLNLSLCGTLAP